MARRKKPAPPDLDKPGLPPLLQGHLRPGGVTPDDDATTSGSTSGSTPGSTPGSPPAQPADAATAAQGNAAAARGKATKSPENVATRPHLEGAEQGPS